VCVIRCCVQHVSSVNVKDGEIVQLEKQLTENLRTHQDSVLTKQKELSALQSQLDKVHCIFDLFSVFMLISELMIANKDITYVLFKLLLSPFFSQRHVMCLLICKTSFRELLC